MNSQTGKMLILGGFAGKVLLATISFFVNLIKLYSTPVIAIQSALSAVASLAIMAGFALLFLSDHNILDLVATIGFGAISINSIITMVMNVAPGLAYNSPALYGILNGSYSLLGFVTVIGMAAWAIRLFKESKMIPALAIAGGYGLALLMTILASYFGINNTLSSLVFIASNCAYAFAAFMDYQS